MVILLLYMMKKMIFEPHIRTTYPFAPKDWKILQKFPFKALGYRGQPCHCYNILRGDKAVKSFEIPIARNEKLGQEAMKAGNAVGLQPKFHQLDLCDKASTLYRISYIQLTEGLTV